MAQIETQIDADEPLLSAIICESFLRNLRETKTDCEKVKDKRLKIKYSG